MSRQVVLITGSSRGIGLAAAVELAKAGFDIALNARSDNEELDNATRTIEELGVKAFKANFDISKINEHTGVLDRIEASLGPITTLVNNAGVGVMSRGDPLDVTEESYDRCLDVNAKALFFLTQSLVKRWLSRDRDPDLHYSVVNVTSSNASAVAVPRSEYCASKAAAAMISKAFAARLGPEGIPVFDVQPGLIATEMTKPVIASYQKRAEEGLCLFPRVGQPEELGTVIASLATNRIPYTTGQVISVDGGMLVPRF
ncbi:3-ketoacyl-ACP reductase [uncultured Ruegeria sp.]|uniref:3-ketoacyl-ACP reductase n=1 Tax=uncultured Ruegeria sp. TaxID=259304 RepID=UPI00261F0D5E|nr:3-ketoacyl-ACP reductase [uncultured Ruegeria sp.]